MIPPSQSPRLEYLASVTQPLCLRQRCELPTAEDRPAISISPCGSLPQQLIDAAFFLSPLLIQTTALLFLSPASLFRRLYQPSGNFEQTCPRCPP